MVSPTQNISWQRGPHHQRSGGYKAGTHSTFPLLLQLYVTKNQGGWGRGEPQQEEAYSESVGAV